MTTKFDKLLPILQENAWPGMVARLAETLGVSSESLFKLGVGYLPVVQFKKGLNYNGWWVFPERDHEATVVGLALRAWDGKKVMYPGSKHGMFYAVNPNHRQGTEAYQSGKDNWVRTADAGLACPVCGKPDGCLLSSEDPDDPRAVICIRNSSPRPMDFGFLHIRKESGRLQHSTHALASSELPVVIVEGMSDAAAAMDMGLPAVGRPSNLAGLAELSKLVRGRHLIIVGENDRRWNPDKNKWDHPGLEGQMAAFDYLRPHCKKVIRLFPPEDYKDLREWCRNGLDREAFLKYAEEGGETRAELKHLESSDPLFVAQAWLNREQSIGGRIILRRYKGQWYRYESGKYVEVEPDMTIRGGLYGFLEDKTCSTLTAGGEERIHAYTPTRSKINDVIDALNRFCPIAETPPCWLNDHVGPNPSWVIAYPNGILDVNRYLDGDVDGSLLDPTPDLFTVATLPYAFDPTAECPAWMEFLETTFDDEDKIKLLQEWLGYNMIPDNSQEKMMMYQGPSRAGKGVCLTMQEALVGRDQLGVTDFEALGSDFGKAPLVGKLSCLLPDVVLGYRTDKNKAMQDVLRITGNDPVNINRKHLQELPNYHLYCRFTMAVNELPTLPDHAGALENRLLVIEFTRSFRGREDRTLKYRLPEEAPGVAVWALEGLKRLRDTGKFTQPRSSLLVLDEFRRLSSPIAEFMEECCDLDHEQKFDIEKSKLFEAWAAWAKERGMNPGMPSRFSTRLKAKTPDVGTAVYQRAGKQRNVFTGIKLKAWAEQRLLGRPGLS